MAANQTHESGWSKAGHFLSNVWGGVNAPEDVISKTRKRVDEVMLVTGALGVAESVATGNLIVFAASAADIGIGAADLAGAGERAKVKEAEKTDVSSAPPAP